MLIKYFPWLYVENFLNVPKFKTNEVMFQERELCSGRPQETYSHHYSHIRGEKFSMLGLENTSISVLILPFNTGYLVQFHTKSYVSLHLW